MLNKIKFLITGVFPSILLLVAPGRINAQTCNNHLVLDYFGAKESIPIITIGSGGVGVTVANSRTQDGPESGYGQTYGGQRDIYYSLTPKANSSTGTNTITIGYAEGEGEPEKFSLNTGTNVAFSKVILTYDGMDYSNSLDVSGANGFSSLDLTKYLSLATSLSYMEGFTSDTIFFSITYRVFSSSTAYSDAVISFHGPRPAISGDTILYAPMTSFQKAAPALSAASLSNVKAVQMIIETNKPSMDYTFRKGLYFYCGGFSPLPVTYGYFKGQSVNGNTQLNWQTFSEKNNKGFEVQRKDQSGKWVSIGFVDAKSNSGQSSVEQRYTFMDRTVLTGTTYYRLKQIDYDGMVDYSQTISVKNEGQTGMSFQVFPNPLTSGKATILLAGNKGLVSFSLADLSGNIVRRWGKGNYTQLEMGNLSKGVYILRATDETSEQTTLQKITLN